MRPSHPTDDTSPGARRLVDQVYASMSPAEKLEQLRRVTLAANRIALAGLRMRHPAATPSQLLRLLARIRLGHDLSRRVYGDP
jgi:hypothetical protein